jgi:AbrB family looped-hinge helix DNA binding protein
MLAKVSAKGQITLPKALRDMMNIQPGDNISVTPMNDHIELRPVTKTLFDVVGIMPVDGPLDFQALREETQRYVAEKVMREMEDE